MQRRHLMQAGAAPMTADVGEQAGCRGQVEHLGAAGLAGGLQARVIGALGGVHGHKVQTLQEAGPRAGIVILEQRSGRTFDETQVSGAVPGLAPRTHNAATGVQPAMHVGHKERGQQLAPRQVAGGPENHDVQRGSV